MCLFSVLMSVYAGEKVDYFNLAMKSVWEDQILKPNEIILVQDGPMSLDLIEVVNKWKKIIGENLIVVLLEENVGLAKALNIGIGHCSGKYIARMDTDDICFNNRFELQVDFLERFPKIDVLGTGIQEIDENGCLMHKRTYPIGQRDIFKYISMASPLAHPTVMIRRTVFGKGFLYNEKCRKAQDVELWFRLIKNGYQITNLSEPTLYFRRTGNTYKKRASFNALGGEFLIYIRGIFSLYGWLTWRYIYPVSRFLIKVLPSGVAKNFYNKLWKKERV